MMMRPYDFPVRIMIVLYYKVSPLFLVDFGIDQFHPKLFSAMTGALICCLPVEALLPLPLLGPLASSS